MIWAQKHIFAFLTFRADFLLFMVMKYSEVFLLAFGKVDAELVWKLLACSTKVHLSTSALNDKLAI